MAGDDELRVFVLFDRVVQQDEERELALRGERGFGFVEEAAKQLAENFPPKT